jgi:two-component sensor histidine kinase
LLFHELATNATKYGGLSTELGTVDVLIATEGDTVSLSWRETGGPAAIEPTTPGGFGSQLIEMSAVRQLGGKVRREWKAEGLAVELTIPAAAFSRR